MTRKIWLIQTIYLISMSYGSSRGRSWILGVNEAWPNCFEGWWVPAWNIFSKFGRMSIKTKVCFNWIWMFLWNCFAVTQNIEIVRYKNHYWVISTFKNPKVLALKNTKESQIPVTTTEFYLWISYSQYGYLTHWTVRHVIQKKLGLQHHPNKSSS